MQDPIGLTSASAQWDFGGPEGASANIKFIPLAVLSNKILCLSPRSLLSFASIYELQLQANLLACKEGKTSDPSVLDLIENEFLILQDIFLVEETDSETLNHYPLL